MSTIYFLNVDEGDCNIIKHTSGHISVIDACCARNKEQIQESARKSFSMDSLRGNFQQKKHPENPISFLNKMNCTSIFRYIQTHPDMDHMDGIKDLFTAFHVINFWDTDNLKEMNEDSEWGKYRKEDWDFYQQIRKSNTDPTVLHLYAGNRGQYYNEGENEKSGGDGLYILAPTRELVNEANNNGDYNDCSYVILYKTYNRKILFCGDSAEKTWNYLLKHKKIDVSNIDILIAPHHGRKSGGNNDYLDVVKPKLTLFGNAKSEYLDYESWNNRGLLKITNNQAGNIKIEITSNKLEVFVSNKKFAETMNENQITEEQDFYSIGILN